MGTLFLASGVPFSAKSKIIQKQSTYNG
jgi:hypothetical protein